ncbi:hypothetical protein PHLCEN_2v1650 [Hermanssonia centrifuga]|uniref:Uncharacterized protein n=1 Tax=Hermanssonia centrifuga TaxID=98765 RepID=A0A2R6RZF2_9APHY|nr:hypothetical protein PHLCEN_2v1650 [Hermanssonia centrifuga]
MKSKPMKSFEEMIPKQYRPFSKVFSKEESKRLPEHSNQNHIIELIPGATGFHSKIYPLSRDEDIKLKKFIDENLHKGYIVNKLRLKKPYLTCLPTLTYSPHK